MGGGRAEGGEGGRRRSRGDEGSGGGEERRVPGRGSRGLSGKRRMMNKLYIGNLSPAVTADDLRQLFGDRKLPLAGQVLLKSGYAFVDYPDQNWAIRAIETLSGEQSALSPSPRLALLRPGRRPEGGRALRAAPGGGSGVHVHFHAPDLQLSPPARSWDGPLPSPPRSGLTPCPPSRSPGATPVPPRGFPRLARSLGDPQFPGSPSCSPEFPHPHL